MTYTCARTGLNNLLHAYSDKTAYAQCTFAYSAGTGEDILLFTGKTNVSTVVIVCCELTVNPVYVLQGNVVPARGPKYFGWDPIFQPEGFDKTYAELEPAVKNTISHRYKALKALGEYFSENVPPPDKKLKTSH